MKSKTVRDSAAFYKRSLSTSDLDCIITVRLQSIYIEGFYTMSKVILKDVWFIKSAVGNLILDSLTAKFSYKSLCEIP